MKSLQTVCLLFATAGLIAAQQYTISTVAGVPGVANLFPTPSSPAVPATQGQLYHPSVVSVDSKGNYYIADSYTFAVRMVTASNGNISTVAGNGAPGTSGDNDIAISAQISDVHGIAVDGSGNVYISDTSTCRIRKIQSPAANATPTISTFAGNGVAPFCGATAHTVFGSPGALAFDSKGNLYVADYGNSTVFTITSSGTASVFAGTGSYGNSGDGGPASKAAIAYPASLAFDSAGNLYIGDEGNSNIRKVDTSGNISTVATGITPRGMGIDSAGAFYFVDGVSNSVRKILPTGGIVTIAGNGLGGYSGDGVPGSQALMSQPSGLAMAPDGSIYFTDNGNDVIRHLVAVASSVGVQDAASEVPGSNLQPGAVSPGEILALFGSGLGPATLTQFTIGSNGLFPTSIAGTSVTFNGTAAPMIYTSAGLVAVIAPYEISGSSTANVVLTYQGKTFTASMPVAPQVPGLFTANTSGTGPAAALNSNLTVNSASNPAKVGSTIVLYATGAGYTTNPVNGQPAPSNCGTSCLPVPQLPVTVKIGNQFVIPTYAGGAPTLVAGVLQVNVQIPVTILPGQVQVQVLVNGYPSQAGVTVAVSQ